MDEQTQVEENDVTNEETNVTEEPVEEAEVQEQPEVSEPEPVQEVEEEEEIPEVPETPQFQPQQIDFSKLPTDAEGNVDPQAFAQALVDMQNNVLAQAQAAARAEFAQARAEDTLLKQAEKKFPEIAKNPELRQLVQSTRYGLIATGKNATPAMAAAQIFKHIQRATQETQANTKQSVTVQRSAQLETSSVRSASTSSTKNLAQVARSGGREEAEAARLALLEKWIEDGVISTRG